MKLDALNKLKSLLSQLDRKEISYVSWKNNHQLESVFLGKGDIDLFVPLDERSKFFDLCRSQDWIEVVNPVAKYPWIAHFYGLGENCEIFHIHVYFKLITGETWIKEYSLPFDNWVIENRVWNLDHEIWVLNSSSQAYLFLIRHLLKCGSISSRLLYKHELGSYEEEWKACSSGIGPDDIQGPIDITDYFDGARAFGEKLELPKISSSLLFRLSSFPFLRYNFLSLPFRRIYSFVLRLVNKIFLKRRKLLPQMGLTIAISGVDGSGKTTMLEEVDRVLGQFITIERFHLGRPQGKLIELIWRALGNKSENSIMSGTSKIITPTSMARAINGAILSLLRFLKARSIINRARRGGLMLVDRWPTDEVGKMDGPRIILGENPRMIVRLCKTIESWAYSNMPQADLCYFFIVPIEVATERNRSRIKENKETDEMISARFLGNLDYKPLTKKTIHFENSGEFFLKRKELLDDICHQISNRY